MTAAIHAELDWAGRRARLGNDQVELEVDFSRGLRLASLRNGAAGTEWIPQPIDFAWGSVEHHATLGVAERGDLWPDLAPPSQEFGLHLDSGDMWSGAQPCTVLPERCRASVVDGVGTLAITVARPDSPLALTVYSEVRRGVPVVRRWTSVTNSGPSTIRFRKLHSLWMSVRPSAADLELYWLEAFHHPSVSKSGMRWRQAQMHQERLGAATRRTLRYGPYPRAHDGSQGCLGWAALRDPDLDEGIFLGWEWSGMFDVDIGDFQEGAGVFGVRAGFSDEGDYRRELRPGEVFESPKAFFGFFRGDSEAAGRATRTAAERLFALPWPEERPPMFVGYDTWSNWQDFKGMTQHLKPERLERELELASHLGVELFILDYDWFPLLGDWRSDPQRFPDGVEALAQRVKAAGMKLGLWMGFGQAHQDAPVALEHPDWLVTKNGKPIEGGWGMRSLCLGYPPCRDWVIEQVCAIVERFQVDWLKHDFDLLPVSDAPQHAPGASDSRLETVLGYYAIMDELHRRFPRLYLDNWTPAMGGADFGNFQRHHSTLTADWYTPVSLRSMAHGLAHLFPYPRTHAYLRCFSRSDERSTYAWRSAFFGNGVYLVNDILAWDAETQAIARAEVQRIKEERVLFEEGETFTLIPQAPGHFGWEARQVYSAAQGRGLVQVFRNHDPATTRAVRLRGLDPAAAYRLEREAAGPAMTASGCALMETGVTVRLDRPFSAETLRFARLNTAHPVQTDRPLPYGAPTH